MRRPPLPTTPQRFTPVSAPPPLSLLDQHARRGIEAAAEAVAAMPGALYRVLYVGPLDSPAMFRAPLEDACRNSRVPLVDWHAGWGGGEEPSVVFCRWSDGVAAIAATAGATRVQLIVWGDVPAERLPETVRDALERAGALSLDPRTNCPASADDWWGNPLARAAASPTSSVNPLVVVAPSGALSLHVDLARMHLEALGLDPVELAPGQDGGGVPPGGAAVVQWTGGPGAAELAALCARCRAAGDPLVLVTGAHAWDGLRGDPAWVGSVGACAVAAGPTESGSTAADLAWLPIHEMWVGARPERSGVDAGALILPAGTTLVEALGHLEVRALPGRLIAWDDERMAVVEVDAGPAGVVVVGVEVVGTGSAGDRDTVLVWLDEIRRWPGAQLALLSAGPARSGPPAARETVARVAFFFSRLDDERSGSLPATGTLSVPGPPVVASALLARGLPAAARALLLRVEDQPRWSTEVEVLLGFLDAERDPAEAITRLRRAAERLAALGETGAAWVLQIEVTLNALLLMARTDHVDPREAWSAVDTWIRDAGTAWVATARHAAVLVELAARAGEMDQAGRFGEIFRSIAGPDEPLAGALAPVLTSLGSQAA